MLYIEIHLLFDLSYRVFRTLRISLLWRKFALVLRLPESRLGRPVRDKDWE